MQLKKYSQKYNKKNSPKMALKNLFTLTHTSIDKLLSIIKIKNLPGGDDTFRKSVILFFISTPDSFRFLSNDNQK